MAETKDSVVNFTGSRVGPTPIDIDRFHEDIDGICKSLKKPAVVAFAVVCVVHPHDGERVTQHRWAKLPGAGVHELVGGSALMMQELIERCPREDHG